MEEKIKCKYLLPWWWGIVQAILITGLVLLAFNIGLSAGEKQEEKKETDTHMEAYLSAIEFCETSGYREIVQLDSNNKLSYGAFQFQFETFRDYGKKYGIIKQEATDGEVKNMIMDYDIQRSIAREMVRNGLDSQHWKICYKKLNGK